MEHFYPHKSHSRKDLINLIQLFKLPIEDVADYNKKQIIDKLIIVMKNIETIEPDMIYYNIKNVNELKEYLIKPNQKKCLSIKDKNNIINTAKLIINYCKNGYCLELSYFHSLDVLYQEARRISQWGDFPSIRRMCNLLNDNPHSNEKIYPVVSNLVQKELDQKKLANTKVINTLTIKKGSFIVTFQ